VRLVAARTLARAAGEAASLAGRVAEADGPIRRAAPVARRAAQRLDGVVAYLQSNETEEIIGDLEAAIRRRPLRALAIAFIAGYLTRRMS
jgi:hypothetical protein